MADFLYPSQADKGREWVADMLMDWQKSGKPFLCFPFLNFTPSTLPPNQGFTMYIYYSATRSDVEHLKKKVKYRFYVVDWGYTPFTGTDVDLHKWANERVWFLCNKAEEISRASGKLHDLYDFQHTDPKKLLASTVRNSIAPVTPPTSIKVVTTYP